MLMVSGVYWAGGSRNDNEDSLALEEVRTGRGNCTLIAVADGIGSLDHGQIASGYAAECFVKWFYDCGIAMRYSRRSRIVRSMKRTAVDCHLEMKRKARENGISWGSTCTVVCIWEKRYVCMQTGDSAAFLIEKKSTHNKKRSRRITEIHRNESGQLTRCIGSVRYDAPDFKFGYLKEGDGMLVASDGFTYGMSDSELTDMLDFEPTVSRQRIEKRLASVGREVSRRGGTDNMTAVYVMCSVEGETDD